jgi:hypothetical protein
MRTIARRVEALEAARGVERAPLLVVEWAEVEPAGVAAVPGRLPQVERLPGESWDACVERAGGLVHGGPLPVLTVAQYRTG